MVLPANLAVQVAPLRIILIDQPHFPRARPVLHVLFALDGIAACLIDFKMNKLIDSVTLAVTFDIAVLVLVDASDKVVGNADIQSAAGPASEDIDKVLAHGGRRFVRWCRASLLHLFAFLSEMAGPVRP